jgi:hypothetical protein
MYSLFHQKKKHIHSIYLCNDCTLDEIYTTFKNEYLLKYLSDIFCTGCCLSLSIEDRKLIDLAELMVITLNDQIAISGKDRIIKILHPEIFNMNQEYVSGQLFKTIKNFLKQLKNFKPNVQWINEKKVVIKPNLPQFEQNLLFNQLTIEINFPKYLLLYINNVRHFTEIYDSFDDLYKSAKSKILSHLGETYGSDISKFLLHLPNQKLIDLVEHTELIVDDVLLVKCGYKNNLLALEKFNILSYYELDDLNSYIRKQKMDKLLIKIVDSLILNFDEKTVSIKDFHNAMIITNISDYRIGKKLNSCHKLKIRFDVVQNII